MLQTLLMYLVPFYIVSQTLPLCNKPCSCADRRIGLVNVVFV
jgi:hypothetical protein